MSDHLIRVIRQNNYGGLRDRVDNTTCLCDGVVALGDAPVRDHLRRCSVSVGQRRDRVGG